MVRLVVFSAFFSFLLGCSQNPNKNMSAKLIESNVSADTAIYEYKNFKQNSSYFIKNAETIDTTYYAITYPIFESEKINKIILPSILMDGEEEPQQAALSFIDGFNEFVQDNNEQNINAAWFKDVKTYVTANTVLFIGLESNIEEYTGGAHGQYLTVYNNYDLKTGNTIALKDIIMPDKMTAFTSIAEKHFRKVENLAKNEALDKDFFFEDGIFALNDNFGLLKDYLTIYYNIYEIKPYSAGTTKLEIPYSELQGLLTTQGEEYINSIK